MGSPIFQVYSIIAIILLNTEEDIIILIPCYLCIPCSSDNPQIQAKPNLQLPSPQPVLSELNYQSYYSIFSGLAIKLGKGRMGRGRTVPVCTAEHHLRPNPIFFVFLKVSEIALN